MNILGRKPGALFGPSISWLLIIAVTCLVVVLGLKVFFDNLQDELREKSANERARLFVGEEIVRGIHGVEKDMYRMAATSNAAALQRVHRGIDQQIDKLKHDLEVLKKGGTVRGELLLNLEGRDEMVREATYHPDAKNQSYVMELIEIAPLLDEITTKPHELEPLLTKYQECLDSEDRDCVLRTQPQIAIFMKLLPPHFERLGENANRLFFDSSERLRELEGQLVVQREHLKKVEMGAIVLVMAFAGLAGLLFLRRIDHANRELETAVDEMRLAKDQAVRASRAKSEFVSRMSHELRTPLNAIIGFAELLEGEPLSPSHRNYVSLINSSGRHLMELINAVLDHAKIEAGSLTLERIGFDFPATIDAVRTIVAERATTKGLEFVASIAADLPKFVVGDPTRLRQVLINLLVNAVKFTERGSVELRVAPEDGRIFFSVRDSGIGMDEDALARMFRAFSQGDDSITRKYGGTGLGLIISKELIQAMGGSIEVESAPGVGTCFWFWLPLQAATEPALADRLTNDGLVGASIASLIPGRVLLVDDNRVNQQLAGAMLDRLGLGHDFADNGAEALRRLDGGRYALVLMDMEMPVMDGITATRQVREREEREGAGHMPIIAMTANAMQEDRERCLAAGMDGYIAKPISRKALQDELRRLFGDASASVSATAVAGQDEARHKPVFDHAVALAMMGDEGLFQEVASMFVASAPTSIEELGAALAAADRPGLKRAAHTLKGLFATFAASDGETAARQLELAAADPVVDMGTCTELVAAVRAHAQELREALASHVAAC